MQLTTTITGAQNVKIGLHKVGQAIPGITKRRLSGWLRVVLKITVPYNGGTSYSVPLRGYKRTGELGRSTTIESGENQTGIYARLKSTARHSVYVIGDSQGEGQAMIHNHYWTTARDATDSQIVALLREIDADMSESFRMAGFGL